ncbi:MAG: DUF58 domain-containing protein [Haloarculaceae archaeon]
MRPTRRGAVLLLVVVAAVAFAWQFGQRSLNAVAAPGIVLFVAAAVQVWWADTPSIERTAPGPDFPGRTRRVELAVDGDGAARIEESIPDGLGGDGVVEATLPATVGYDLRYEERGVYELGPTTVRVRDALGLVESRTEIDAPVSVVVYPEVYSIGGPDAFARLLGSSADREAFDRLREYIPGDSLRDVHWKSSAKRADDLLVREFSNRADEGTITIAADADPDRADEMAAATATVAIAALDAGMAVAVRTPTGRVEGGYGDDQRKRVLDHLARATPGTATAGDADVRVSARDDGVRIDFRERTYAIDDIVASHENPLSREVVS